MIKTLSLTKQFFLYQVLVYQTEQDLKTQRGICCTHGELKTKQNKTKQPRKPFLSLCTSAAAAAAAAAKSLQSCPTLCDPYQASPSMGFSRQEHWSGLPFPSPMHESGK